MRDIKFRAWNKILNRMDNWYDLVDKNLRNIFIMKDHNGYELMQYTGLHDKNGKEIYEGDIVKIHKHSYDYGLKQDEIGQIKFIDGAFGFYREKTKNEYYFNDLATENGYGELDYYEVIGNVWENGNLLNDSK